MSEFMHMARTFAQHVLTILDRAPFVEHMAELCDIASILF